MHRVLGRRVELGNLLLVFGARREGQIDDYRISGLYILFNGKLSLCCQFMGTLSAAGGCATWGTCLGRYRVAVDGVQTARSCNKLVGLMPESPVRPFGYRNPEIMELFEEVVPGQLVLLECLYTLLGAEVFVVDIEYTG